MEKETPTKKTRAVAVVPETNTAEGLIKQAIDKGVDVGTMERLLAMRTTIRDEQAKEAFTAAMAAFQAECPVIGKTKNVVSNGRTLYSYTPIESIVIQVRDALRAHGFSYSFEQVLTQDTVKVACVVTHSMGHSEKVWMEVRLGTKTGVMSNSQQDAAASTFAKRYAFCNAFGILTGDEDTDGADFDKSPVKDDAVPTITYDDHENVPTSKGPSQVMPWRKHADAVPKTEDPILVLKDKILKKIDSTVFVKLEGAKEYQDYVLGNTGLDLKDQTESNLTAILERLEALS